MKRLFFTTALVILIAVFCAQAALALASGSPSQDSYVRETNPDANFDGEDLSVVGSTNACNPTDTVFLQWDLSSIADGETVHSATLKLTPRFVTSTSDAMLSLYETGDGWTEGAITANNDPAIGNLIQTISAPTAVGEQAVFSNGALATYLNNQAAGDNIASFALRFSSGCAASVSGIIFQDEESPADKPDLQMSNPTALSLFSASASSPSGLARFNPWIWLVAFALFVALLTFNWKPIRRR
jgi:hypothetical protein